MSDFPAMQPDRYPGQYPQNPYDGVSVGVPGPIPLGGVQPQQPPAQPVPGQAPAGAPAPVDSRALLDQIIQMGNKQGAYDSTADFEKYLKLLQTAGTAKSPQELQAEQLTAQATYEHNTADYEKNNPLAPPSYLKSPEYSELKLPGVPENVQPHPNGIASLGAGIAGLFARRAAGRFGAEALSGAIQAAARENDARKQKYQFELQQSLLKHQEEVRRTDAQARIDASNNAMKNAFTVDQHTEQMKGAIEGMHANMLDAEAGSLKKFVEGNKEAEQAKAQASVLDQMIEAKQKQSKEALDRSAKAAEMLARLDEQKSIADERAKTAADAEAERVRHAKETEAQAKANAAEKAKQDQISEHDRLFRESMEQNRLREEHDYHQSELGVRIRGQDLETQRSENSSRGATMHHKTAEESMAETDVGKLKTRAEAAWKRYDASPNPQLKREAQSLDATYNKARQNYIDIYNRNDEANSYTDPATGRLKRKLPTAPGAATMRYNPATGQVEVIR